jgi:NAD(P)-dependent dehydrogenase (short-subunit alcohol dehydrogenase family)
LFVQTDVDQEDDIIALVQKTVGAFGGLHIAFNHAGAEGQFDLLTTEQTVEHYHQVCDINIRGVLLSMKHEIPAMLRSGGGAIVNNSSVGGHIGFPGSSVYVASKFAVVGLTKTAALEFARQGIRVNSVSPGPIQREMFDRSIGLSAKANHWPAKTSFQLGNNFGFHGTLVQLVWRNNPRVTPAR